MLTWKKDSKTLKSYARQLASATIRQSKEDEKLAKEFFLQAKELAKEIISMARQRKVYFDKGCEEDLIRKFYREAWYIEKLKRGMK